jgi:tetratricopeptide (TPR) repeat protein
MRIVACSLLSVATALIVGGQTLQDVQTMRVEGRVDEAQQALQKIIEQAPNDVEAYYALGEVLLERDDYAGAEREFATIGELGNESLSLIGRGLVLVEQQRSEEAKKLFNEADEKTPDAQELIAKIEGAETEEVRAAARAEAAKLADLYYGRGLANALLRDYAASAADLETSLQLDPSNAKAHYYAGLAYNAQNRPDMMISHFETFLKMAPEGPEADRARNVLRGAR